MTKSQEDWWRELEPYRKEIAAKEALAEADRNAARDRQPVAHCYRRCSHKDSADSGLGMTVQKEQIVAYVNFLRVMHKDLAAARWYEDEIVSARKVLFLNRKGGRAMNVSLRKGDHVIFSKLDRGFRDLLDLTTMIRMWNDRGIAVHFISPGVDTSTAAGMCVINIVGAFAQFDSDQKSERGKENAANLKAQQRPCGRAPRGYKIVGNRNVKRLVKDKEFHAAAKRAYELFENGILTDDIRGVIKREYGYKWSIYQTGANRRWWAKVLKKKERKQDLESGHE